MRHLFLILLFIPCLVWGQQNVNVKKTTPASQSNKQVKWEYYIYKVNPTPRDYDADYIVEKYPDTEANFFSPNIEVLDSLGGAGWEMVNAYTEVYTVFPNMGQKGYHTGVKENVKVKNICFVFKRSYTGTPEPKPQLGDNGLAIKPLTKE